MTEKNLFIAHTEGCCFDGEPGDGVYPIPTDSMSGQTFMALSKIGFDMYDPDEFFVLRLASESIEKSKDSTSAIHMFPSAQKFFVRDIIGNVNPYKMSLLQLEEAFNSYTAAHSFYTIAETTPPASVTFRFKVRITTNNLTFYLEITNDGLFVAPLSTKGFYVDKESIISEEGIDIYFSKKFYYFFGLTESVMKKASISSPYHAIYQSFENETFTSGCWCDEYSDDVFTIESGFNRWDEPWFNFTSSTPLQASHQFIAVELSLPEYPVLSRDKLYISNLTKTWKSCLIKIIPLNHEEGRNEHDYDFRNTNSLDFVYLGKKNVGNIRKLCIRLLRFPIADNEEVFITDTNLYYEFIIKDLKF